MANGTIVQVPQAPPGQAIHLFLYKQVTEIEALRERLASGKFEFALIDARSIVSRRHLCAAIFRAVNDQSNGRMKTRNVHSEIVLALSINNNITEAYRKFGISKESNNLIVVKIGTEEPEQILQQLDQAIKGERMEATEQNIASSADPDLIRKIYKINSPSSGLTRPKGHKEPIVSPASDVKGVDDLETTVIELIALRGAT